LIIPCVEGRPEGLKPERLSGLYGNILPIAWSRAVRCPPGRRGSPARGRCAGGPARCPQGGVG
jgi:hypothetical protein